MNNISNKILATPGGRLRHLRALLGVSRAFLQEKYSIPEVTLKSWENGTVKLTPLGAKRCVDMYRGEGLIVSEDWVLSGIGLDPTTVFNVGHFFSDPTIKDIPCEDEEACMIRDASAFKNSYSNAVILIVSGDDMRPFYKPGDYVGGKMRYGEQIKVGINKDCIVYLKDNSKFFRRVIKSHDRFNLACLNPNEGTIEPVLYNVEIESLAPVIWHRRKDD